MVARGHCAECGRQIKRGDGLFIDALDFCHDCGKELKEGS